MQQPDSSEDAGDGLAGISLRELEVLQALVRAGTAMNAARTLGISQSAVSRRLAQLEERLGQKLFERSGGRLVPTIEALSIHEQLGPIFDALARIARQAGRGNRTHRGALKIVAPPTIAHRFLPNRVASFSKRNPELDVTFEVLSSDSLVTGVAECRYDVGLTDTLPSHDGIQSELLLATEAICILPSRHRLVGRDVIRPEDLEGEPYVAMTRRHSSRVAIDRVFERAGVTRRIVIETATVVSAAEFVREGLGVSLVNPFPIVHQLGRGIELRPFLPAIGYRASFLLPSSRPPSAATRAFIEAVRPSLDHTAYPIIP